MGHGEWRHRKRKWRMISAFCLGGNTHPLRQVTPAWGLVCGGTELTIGISYESREWNVSTTDIGYLGLGLSRKVWFQDQDLGASSLLETVSWWRLQEILQPEKGWIQNLYGIVLCLIPIWKTSNFFLLRESTSLIISLHCHNEGPGKAQSVCSLLHSALYSDPVCPMFQALGQAQPPLS